MKKPPLKLNLGCSDQLLAGYVNVDRVEPCDVVFDLSLPTVRPWPWETSSVDEIRAHDIFEHLPNKHWTMNEAHRVLKPGGVLDLFVPTTDGRGAFQDPTHCSWWTPNDLLYYCRGKAEWERFHRSYGITCCFDIRSFEHDEYPGKVWKLQATLEAVK